MASVEGQVTNKKGRELYHVMLGSCGEIPVCINSKVAKLGGSQQLFLNFGFCYFAFQLFLYFTLQLERSIIMTHIGPLHDHITLYKSAMLSHMSCSGISKTKQCLTF